MRDYKFILYEILNTSAAQLDALLDRFLPMEIVEAIRAIIENGKELSIWEIYSEIFASSIWEIFDDYCSASKKLTLMFTPDGEQFMITAPHEFYESNKENVDKLVKFMEMPLLLTSNKN